MNKLKPLNDQNYNDFIKNNIFTYSNFMEFKITRVL